MMEALRILSTRLDVQSRLRTELLGLPLPITPESLASARYLDAFWRELLRFSEPTQLERVAMQDDVIPLASPIVLLDGTEIDAIPVRKGQLASFNVMQVNKDPERFGKTAEDFDPDRWLTPAGDKLRQYKGLGPGAWDGLLNFGSASTRCAGDEADDRSGHAGVPGREDGRARGQVVHAHAPHRLRVLARLVILRAVDPRAGRVCTGSVINCAGSAVQCIRAS